MLVPLTITRSESNFSNSVPFPEQQDNVLTQSTMYEDMKGLSNEEAKRLLISSLMEIMNKHYEKYGRMNKESWKLKWDYLSLSSIIATIGCVSAILTMGITILLSNWKNGLPLAVPLAIIEATLLMLFIVIDTAVRYREKVFSRTSLLDRIKTVISEFEKHGIVNVQEIRIPHSPSISCVRVLRDEKLIVLPTNLLVENDIVELAFGEMAPCKMKFIHPMAGLNGKSSSEAGLSPESSSFKPHRREFSDSATFNNRRKDPYGIHLRNLNSTGSKNQLILERNQFLSPSLLMMVFPSWHHIPANEGRFRFVLQETPFAAYVLENLIVTKRPKSVLSTQADILRRIARWSKFVFLILAFLANGLLLLIFPNPSFRQDSSKFHYYLSHLIYYPFFVIIPFIPLNIEFLLQTMRLYGDARIFVLFEALKKEKTPYTNYDDSEDEFDVEAGPPTKVLSLPFYDVLKKIVTLVFSGDRMSVTRTKNIFESLASTSVICYVDKEGTLGGPFPVAEKFSSLGPNGEIETLDLTYDMGYPNHYRFVEDKKPFLPSLKPFGLNCILNTHCGAINGRKRKEAHRKLTNLQLYGKSIPSRQTCICMIGREIGFTDKAVQTFQPWREIYTFAPTHPSVHEIYHCYSNLEVPSLLSLIVKDKRDESFQTLTEGSLELVLDSSTEYWNGSSVVSFTPMEERKLYEFYLNAIINDLQCVAYSYRPLLPKECDALALKDQVQPNQLRNQVPHVFVEIPPNTDTFNVKVSPINSETPVEKFRKTHHRVRAESLQLAQKSMKPPLRQDSPSVTATHPISYEDIIRGQVFLGLTTFAHQPKQDVAEFVEDLGSGGIRFVYFSRLGERESKAFVERLGVETDWNSCILLSNPDDDGISGGYLEPSDIKARLPRGINAIKHHLMEVDDIPLHVSLFAECTTDAVQQMIKVFQEYGKVVCCVGSALQMANSLLFATADVGVAVEPLFSKQNNQAASSGVTGPTAATYVSNEYSTNAISASLSSIASALFMQFETSPYVLTDVIREARNLMQNGIQMLVFLIGCNVNISVGILASSFLLLPPLFSVLHAIVLMYFMFPVLVLPYLFTPYDPNIMTLMPVKNIEHLPGLKRFISYMFIRFVPNALVCVGLFYLCLAENIDSSKGGGYIAKGLIEYDWIYNSGDAKMPLKIFHAQTMVMTAFLIFSIVLSVTFLHRHTPIWSFPPYKNRYFCFSIILVIIFQAIFWTISYVVTSGTVLKIPISFYIVCGVWIPLIIVIQESVKVHDLRHFLRFQKRSKLEFNTKLGMHSPV